MYPVVDSYRFPLVSSRVECVCDCPGGAARCGHRGHDMCGNTTQVTGTTQTPKGCYDIEYFAERMYFKYLSNCC